MQSPTTMFVEMGAEQLAQREPEVLIRQVSHFNGLGPGRWNQLTATVGIAGGEGLAHLSEEGAIGYLLGLETARAVLASMPAAVQAGVTI
jgi:hypothetical protein